VSGFLIFVIRERENFILRACENTRCNIRGGIHRAEVRGLVYTNAHWA
jgi:hypothetical protein